MLTTRAAAAGLALLLASPAQAESIRATLEDFAFFGRWSPRCEEPASLTNSSREAFVTADGRIQFTENFGDISKPNVYVVLEARRPAPDLIVLRAELNGTVQQDLTMMKTMDGRLRTIANRRVGDGTMLVKDGTVARTGEPTPSMARCSNAAKAGGRP